VRRVQVRAEERQPTLSPPERLVRDLRQVVAETRPTLTARLLNPQVHAPRSMSQVRTKRSISN
jgi:hypothetical protein